MENEVPPVVRIVPCAPLDDYTHEFLQQRRRQCHRRVFFMAEPPEGASDIVWFNPAAGNKPHVWNGAEWVQPAEKT